MCLKGVNRPIITLGFLTLGFLVVSVGSGNAQKIKYKDSNKVIERKIANILDSLSHESEPVTGSKIELSFWIVDLSTDSSQLLVINGYPQHWSVVRYSFLTNAITSNYKKTMLIPTKDWDVDWNSIITNNYLSLPDESTLEKARRSNEEGAILIVGDGKWFGCRIRTKKGVRAFGYGNPGDKSQILANSEPKYAQTYHMAQELMNLIIRNFLLEGKVSGNDQK